MTNINSTSPQAIVDSSLVEKTQASLSQIPADKTAESSQAKFNPNDSIPQLQQTLEGKDREEFNKFLKELMKSWIEKMGKEWDKMTKKLKKAYKGS